MNFTFVFNLCSKGQGLLKCHKTKIGMLTWVSSWYFNNDHVEVTKLLSPYSELRWDSFESSMKFPQPHEILSYCCGSIGLELTLVTLMVTRLIFLLCSFRKWYSQSSERSTVAYMSECMCISTYLRKWLNGSLLHQCVSLYRLVDLGKYHEVMANDTGLACYPMVIIDTSEACLGKLLT